MAIAEFEALKLSQRIAIEQYGPEHQFSAKDIGNLHRLWLGPFIVGGSVSHGQHREGWIPVRARSAHSVANGRLRTRAATSTYTLHQKDVGAIATSLAEVHAELILVHPFRDGNGRVARLVALLMASQAGLPLLDFNPFSGKGKRAYIAAIHAAMGMDYEPLTRLFVRTIDRSERRAASSTQ